MPVDTPNERATDAGQIPLDLARALYGRRGRADLALFGLEAIIERCDI
jgi:hypothetical protein